MPDATRPSEVSLTVQAQRMAAASDSTWPKTVMRDALLVRLAETVDAMLDRERRLNRAVTLTHWEVRAQAGWLSDDLNAARDLLYQLQAEVGILADPEEDTDATDS